MAPKKSPKGSRRQSIAGSTPATGRAEYKEVKPEPESESEQLGPSSSSVRLSSKNKPKRANKEVKPEPESESEQLGLSSSSVRLSSKNKPKRARRDSSSDSDESIEDRENRPPATSRKRKSKSRGPAVRLGAAAAPAAAARPRARPAARAVGVVAAHRGPLDGGVRGRAIDWGKRRRMEDQARIVYSFPRFLNALDRRHNIHRRLDLVLEDEASDGETVNDVSYSIDSILAMDSHAVLVNWQGYKYPTWQHKWIVENGPALKEYNKRVKILEGILKFLTASVDCPLMNMRRLYPNMVIMQTMDYGEYVKQPGIVYISGLNKRERQINDYCDEMSGRAVDDVGPTLAFEDWSTWQNSTIPLFEYILDSEMSRAAAAINDNLACNSRSCQCTKTCDHRGSTTCCANKSGTKLAYLSKGRMGNTVKVRRSSDDDDHKDTSEDFIDAYECGDACSCDNRCLQRAVQFGRRIPLVVFMHHEKGWTLRAGANIAKGAFVCEYVGEMLTAKEAALREDQMYQFDLKTRTRDGKDVDLVIDSSKKGNESRFIAHSCDPNLFTWRVHFEVAGRPKRHIGLFASKDIEAGEELTFDYYPAKQDPTHFHNTIGFICRCGTSKCREKKYQAKMNRRRSTT